MGLATSDLWSSNPWDDQDVLDLMVDALAIVGIGVLVFVVIPRLNQRFNGKFARKYGTAHERVWREHPEWMVIAILVGLVIAILVN